MLKPSWQLDKIAYNRARWEKMTPEEREAEKEMYKQSTWEERNERDVNYMKMVA